MKGNLHSIDLWCKETSNMQYHNQWNANYSSRKYSVNLELFSYSVWYLGQVINESTYLNENSSSRIDLIFTSQQNLVMYAGVYPYTKIVVIK